LKEKEKRSGWLYGWKDIAAYIGCDITTAQKYAKEFKAPVWKIPETKKVVSIPSELNKWLENTCKKI